MTEYINRENLDIIRTAIEKLIDKHESELVKIKSKAIFKN